MHHHSFGSHLLVHKICKIVACVSQELPKINHALRILCILAIVLVQVVEQLRGGVAPEAAKEALLPRSLTPRAAFLPFFRQLVRLRGFWLLPCGCWKWR